VSAPVDLLRDGAMHNHLFLYHNVWANDCKTRAELDECHKAAHTKPWMNTFPHTHKAPKPREEFRWNG